MGPDWWEQAAEAAEDQHEGEWGSMSDAERDEAVAEVLRGRADQLKDEAKEARRGT